jgi:hypothetical protein
MNVVLGIGRHIVVDHHIDDWNIETAVKRSAKRARGDNIPRTKIGCNENSLLACFELVQRAKTLVLRHLAVERHCTKAEISYNIGDLGGGLSRRGENENASSSKLVQQVDEIALFLLERDEQVLFEQRFRCGVPAMQSAKKAKKHEKSTL